MHPAVSHVLAFFAYDHLPANLQEVSRPFHDLAHVTATRAPDSQETTVALRKLLEAKDAAVRATLPQRDPLGCAKEVRKKSVEDAAKKGFQGD